jgi:alpha-1,6-mannosyltransferase
MMGSYDLCLLLIIIMYVIICPYTKVEESFNLQAVYDLHHFNPITSLAAYDHLEFPGVVPRTFLGPLLLYFISYPFYFIFYYGFHYYHLYFYQEDFSEILTSEGDYLQILYRCILGFISWLSLVHFKNSFQYIFPNRSYQRIQEIFIICCSLQFHLNFYISRTLPNTFAFILVINAFAFWFSVCSRSLIISFFSFISFI